jgi:Bacteriophage head to tail connecting protein
MSSAFALLPAMTAYSAGGASSPKAASVLQRWSELLSQRTMHDYIWQDLVDMVLPGSADITHVRVPGESRTERLFETTAVQAAQTLAASLMGAITNPAIQWFRLRFREDDLSDNQEVATWLNACDEIMASAYNASNFYQAAHTFYLNLAVFGTAAMYSCSTERLGHKGSREAYLRFQTLPTGHYVIAENYLGKVDTLIRSFDLTPRQARQQFGEVALSRDLRLQAADPRHMDVPKRFLHAVYPRELTRQGGIGNKKMPYEELYLELDSRHVCWESGYEEFPFLVARWETLGTSPWGFGPGHIALPDVRTINTLRELMLLQLQLWVQPPLMQMEEAVIGSISLESLAVNVITREDALRPLDLTGRPDLVKLEEEALKKAIRESFYADALTGLPPADATTMTAYEVAQRIEQMQRLMGPAFTRLLSEMLDPLADRTFGLLWRAGVLPPVPRPVVEAARRNRGQLDVEYEGPLARAQRGVEVKAIGESLAVAGQIVGLTQKMDILDNLDLDGFWREVAKANGTPRHLIRDTAQVLRDRAERAQQQAMQQQAAMQAQQAESLGKAAPAIKAFTGMGAQAA